MANGQNQDPNRKKEPPVTPPPPLPENETRNNFDDMFSYAKSNTRDLIAYVLMILGILLLFFQPLYGGLLIGLVAGAYFSKEILEILRNYEKVIDQEGLVRSLILAGTLLAFFISAPAIFVGMAVVIGLRFFIYDRES